MDTKSPEETNPPGSLEGFSPRELTLLENYVDRDSPGYLNGTRSAEIARYAGSPGSNQLAVQASRTLKKARRLGVLSEILNKKGCTLERASERLAACLEAKRTRVFLTKTGDIIEGPTEDDYSQQRQAAKLVFQLHGALGGNGRQQQPSIAAPEPEPAPDHQEQGPEEYANALAIVSGSDPVDRESLRDVLECDAKSAEFVVREPQSGTSEQAEKQPVLEGDSAKA